MSPITGCCLSVLLAVAAPLPAAAGEPEAPLYTNADLERVSPLRDQTGVESVPAVKPSQEGGRSRHAGRKREKAGSQAREETYWRRQAERHRKRQETLTAKADRVRLRIADEKLRRRLSLAMRDDKILERLEEQLAAIERQRAEEDDRFFERARRAGALPGWLR